MGFGGLAALSEVEDFVASACASARLLRPSEALEHYDLGVRLERLGKALKLSMSEAAVADGEWRRLGYSHPEEWLAQRCGISPVAALREHEVAEDLKAAPATSAAFARGELSFEQAEAVASAVAAAGTEREEELMRDAATKPLGKLRRKTQRIRAASRKPGEAQKEQERIHAGRSGRVWETTEGAIDARFHMALRQGAVFKAVLDSFVADEYRKASADGRHDSREALTADALASMAQAAAAARAGGQWAGVKGPRPIINVRVDYEALRRGYPTNGEVCEIEGVGPVPMELVLDMARDALLRILLFKGKDVTRVAHARTATPIQKLALREAADYRCIIRRCSRRYGLEADHVREWAKGGLTQLDNLGLPCSFHHRLKSAKGYRIVQAEDGEWDLLPPLPTRPTTPMGSDAETTLDVVLVAGAGRPTDSRTRPPPLDSG